MRRIPPPIKSALKAGRHALPQPRAAIPRRIIRPVYLFGSLLTVCGRLLLRTFPLLTPAFFFYLIWIKALAYYDKRIEFAAGFPRPRTYFVITIATVPAWGLTMVVYSMVSAMVKLLARTLRGCVVGKRPSSYGYAPVPRDLDDDVECRRHAGGEMRDLAMSTASRTFEGRVRRCCRPSHFLSWGIYLAAVLLGVHMATYYRNPFDNRFREVVELANRETKAQGYGKGEKIFIAALFHNNADVFPYWKREMTKVINYLGTDNVFVSIVESHSKDGTPEMLRQFDTTLETMNVPRRIVIGESTLARPRYDTPKPRIPFLAALRNIAMEPLTETGGYTRVLWSNDIFIEAESVVELIHTRDGDYDFACGVDFGPWGFYDMWVIRDRLGRLGSTVWPYLYDTLGYQGIVTEQPAPVFTCWNGIASMRADPFIRPALRSGNQLSKTPLVRPLASSHPLFPLPAGATPSNAPVLKFRTSAPDECFSSECFLLPYDMRRVYGLQKHYINPRVVNAYWYNYYLWFKWVVRHPVVMWWIRKVEAGRNIYRGTYVIGIADNIWRWDGGECHPFGGIAVKWPEWSPYF